MLLDTTTKTIELTVNATAATTESPVTVEYVDLTTAAFSPASSDTVSNGTSVVTIVAAPAASTQRQVKEITIYNADTVNHTYTVKYNDNATKRTVIVAAVAAGFMLQYKSDIGWKIVPASPLGQIPGTTTNDNATAGMVGEFISSTVLIADAVPLVDNTPKDVTSISLTAGDWNVWGNVWTSPNVATVNTQVFTWITDTSATIPTMPNGGAGNVDQNSSTGKSLGFSCGMRRFSLSSPTTIYLGVRCLFTVNTQSAYGFIGARRVR